MRAWLALLALPLAAAGCLGGGDEHTDYTCPDGTVLHEEDFDHHDEEGFDIADECPTPSPTPTPTPTPSPTPPAAANLEPTAQISASTRGGTLPLLVEFTLDAADPDGDGLEWAFDADGDLEAEAEGTEEELPFEASFNYTAEGRYNATLYVTDGEAVAEAAVTVDVTAATPASQDVAGETTASSAACPQVTGDVVGFPPFDPYPEGNPAEGVEWIRFEVEPQTIGLPYVWVYEQAVPLIFGVSLDFYDADGAQLSSDLAGEGNVPAGAAFGVFYPCGPGPISFTYAAG